MGRLRSRKGIENLLRRDALIHDDSKVTAHHGKLRDGMRAWNIHAGKRIDIELEQDRGAGQLELAQQPRMQLADPPRVFAIDHHSRRTTWMQRRMSRCIGRHPLWPCE